MSKADYTFLKTCTHIFDGYWDNDSKVRPKWEDGTSAHTISQFAVVNRYDLNEEFPISSLRKTNWRAAIDEILWIWQLKSNNVADLNSKIWDQWANTGSHPDQVIGSIGEAYGAQLRKKSIYGDQELDQVDKLLLDLKNCKNGLISRRIITELYNHQDLHKMNLAPCVHQITFSVKDGKLNMMLNQRSNDTLAAGNWNVVQYAALQMMLAQVTGLQVGEMVHMIVDSHIYDKHVPMVLEILFNRMDLLTKLTMNKAVVKAVRDINEKSADECLDLIMSLESEYDWRENSLYDLIKQCKSAQSSIGFDNAQFLDSVKSSNAYRKSKRIVELMLENPKIEKALGFTTPKLVLDPNVKDFYDFKSPKMRTGNKIWVEDGKIMREGKIIDNPDSSFQVEDYHPELEGKELSMRVPVAE